MMNVIEDIGLSYIQKVADKKIIEIAMEEYLIRRNNEILNGCIRVNDLYPNGSSPELSQFKNSFIEHILSGKLTT